MAEHRTDLSALARVRLLDRFRDGAGKAVLTVLAAANGPMTALTARWLAQDTGYAEPTVRDLARIGSDLGLLQATYLPGSNPLIKAWRITNQGRTFLEQIGQQMTTTETDQTTPEAQPSPCGLPDFPVDDTTLDRLEAALNPPPGAESTSVWPLLEQISRELDPDGTCLYHDFCVIRALITEVRRYRIAEKDAPAPTEPGDVQ